MPLRVFWPLFVFPKLPPGPLNWLELGSLEGRSALWLYDYLLQHRPGSKIHCVDIWKLWPSPDQESCYEYEAAFDHNTQHIEQIIKHKGTTAEILPTLVSEKFHGCYIDASHDEEDVLHDARAILPLMHPGGMIIFDDYEHLQEYGVKQAVQKLLVEWAGKAEVIHTAYQITFRVIA
jgi:predicted O-methyltransferase YrrM